MVMQDVLACEAVRVSYGAVTVLAGLDLQVAPGEVMALLGPSGSGKTTLLHAVAGLRGIDSGEIRIAGRTVSGGGGNPVPPEERRVAMVFQNYALWPHLTALDTVAYPLLRAGEPTRSAKAAAHRLLDALGIGALAGRLPSELSGGQQQRVGLARALASNPLLFLFDEPTAHLDAALRFSLQQELAHRREASGAAAVYATHDPAEALAMADRVALLRNGTLAQVGSPVDVYERPVDAWCAQLAGPADVIAARLVSTADHVVTVAVNGVTLTLPGGSTVPPGPVRLVVRPAWAHLGGPLTGVVVRVWYTGGSSDIVIRTAGGRVRIATDRPDRVRPGDEVTWGLHRAWLVGSGEAAP